MCAHVYTHGSQRGCPKSSSMMLCLYFLRQSLSMNQELTVVWLCWKPAMSYCLCLPQQWDYKHLLGVLTYYVDAGTQTSVLKIVVQEFLTTEPFVQPLILSLVLVVLILKARLVKHLVEYACIYIFMSGLELVKGSHRGKVSLTLQYEQ